jgi:hypothetical protein
MNAPRFTALAVLTAFVVSAAEPAFDHGPVLAIIEENDLFVKTDRHYTQGLKLSYFHSDGCLPLCSRWISDSLPQIAFENKVSRVGYSLGQNIYTPADITNRFLQPNDRPYAGWLYVGGILQRRGWSLGHRLTEEDFEFELGVIGPWALAGEAQTWVHELRGFDTPKGWRHQAANEPGVRLKYSRAVRLFEWEHSRIGLDFTPRAGLSLGNVDTSTRASAMIRLGYNLPDDFGHHVIDSLATTSGGISKSRPVRWGVYGFVAVEGRCVFYNQMLDGGMYHDGHSVQREWFVGDAIAGFVVQAGHFEFGYANTWRSPEFRPQTEHDSFGSVFVKARF